MTDRRVGTERTKFKINKNSDQTPRKLEENKTKQNKTEQKKTLFEANETSS